MFKNNENINEIQEGDGFGEAALMHKCARTATIKATVDSTFWGIDTVNYKKLINDSIVKIFSEKLQIIYSTKLFQNMNKQQKSTLAEGLII